MKTQIQEELFQFMIPRFKGKEYSEQLKMIREMQDYLAGMKQAIIADNAEITCTHCKNSFNVSKWQTIQREETYKKTSQSYDEEDVKVHSMITYGICPACRKENYLNERVLSTERIGIISA